MRLNQQFYATECLQKRNSDFFIIESKIEIASGAIKVVEG